MRLERNRRSQSIQLTLPVAVLTDLVEELACEITGVLQHLETLTEALGALWSTSCNNTIPFDGLSGVCTGNLDAHDIAQNFLDQLRGFAHRTERLEVPECLGNPVPDLAVFLKSLNVRTAGDEGRVEHGGAHAVVHVVGYHTLGAILVLALCVDGGAFGANDEGERLRGENGGLHAVEGDLVVAVTDDDGDTTADDARSLRGEVELGEADGGLAVVITQCLRGDGRADHLGHGLSEGEVDLCEALACEPLVNDWVVTVVELEGKGLLDVHLLNLGEGVIEKLRLVVIFLELGCEVAALAARNRGWVRLEALVASWRVGLEAVGPVVHRALGDAVALSSVPVMVEERANRSVDGDFFPVHAQTTNLCILI